MYISLAVHDQPFVFWKHFSPELSVSLICPVVFVESAPKNGSAVFVKILFRCNAVVEALNIHDADGVIRFFADLKSIPSDDVHSFFVCVPDNLISASCQ